MNNQRWLSMSFFAFFFTWGVFLPYWTGWLTIEKGLSVTAASFIMGAGMIARSLSTLLVFPYLTRKMSMIRVMKWMSLTALILTLLYLPDSPFIVLLFITILFSAVYPMILPAVESSASVLMQTEGIHYGKSRSFGSIGYTIALLLIGAATAIWTEQAILYIMIVGLAIATLFFMRPAPEALRLNSVKDDTTKRDINFKSLFTSKGFAIVMILAILLQGAHASYYNFGFIFLDNLGVNGIYIGIILNIAVLFEILFFTRADRLLANVKVSTMFLIAGIGSTVRWILIALFPYISVFIGTQLLHALSFGVAHFAFIKFISEKLPHDQIATAQGMYVAFAMSLSTAILTFLGGYLYDISPRLAFLGMIICSVPAIIIVLMTRKKYAY
ncbi:3-phenylpropionate MFS transporter [Sporosarcina sp. E16_3]|uniref:3-phenylpropionate MFS transporter n=1 Tax=Sporosarcina sp. E16_3 TaxID=2789293 RepID=UPI001A92484A|nr:3-phenylpropionate MFS transporter [Sporosarcina sp. E16_3]MBO0602129.1 3-phenylpropionate MFS transporter [Sporosarcina sp. E16_3]